MTETPQQTNIQIRSLGDLRQDPDNARRHNPRNVGQIERSISTDGFGRGGLLAEDFTIAAGNATAEAAAAAGMDEVIIIDSDGTKPVYIRRTDLKAGSEEFRRLALSDNRAAELAEWSPEVLQGFMDEGLDLGQFWFEQELAQVLAANNDPFDPNAEWAGMPEYEQEDQRAVKRIVVNFLSVDAVDQFARLTGQKITMATDTMYFPPVARESRQGIAYVESGEA